jgi:hypothetical protein
LNVLLVDGVKYCLWTPEKEEEVFHPIVKEHYEEILGFIFFRLSTSFLSKKKRDTV